MPRISVRNINKSYASLQVLRDIGLEVEDGEFTVLLGPSGCGKSTLLSAIAGLDDIDGGRIEIGGVDVTDREPSERGIAMVFQSYALYPTMKVRGNMSFGLRVKSVARTEIIRRVARAAEMLQITALLDRKPAQLSGGQRQRVAIGRALVQEAKVFLFDEPLSNLDAKLRTEMRVEIKKLHRDLKPTIVYVTHDQIEAMTLATRIAVMRGGRIEQYATPDELYERPQTLFVAGFVGSPAMNFLAADMRNHSIRLGEATLSLAQYPFVQQPASVEAIVFGIRPEHVALADDATTNAVVDADTLFIEPMGADTLGWFEIAGQRIAARLQPQRARTVSGRVRLTLDVAHASVFSQTTEQRL